MMCGLIDLNTVENEDETAMYSVSPSSSVASGNSELASASSSSAVSMELWHACAGPLISLPKKGSAVVYFPQGQVEHLQEQPGVVYNLPPHVFCRVVDVKLHAEAANDDVYAQVSLIPDQQIERKWREGIVETKDEDEDAKGARMSMTPHMFCKTLTASDTSTHGGFSVPRRAAEDCFPPLDYKQQRPSQELVAKDLHGTEWKFRHIYRGQPRRHLLTTGWSAFVNKKKLVSGDAVLFLRGGDGVLRLGVRRAAEAKTDANVHPLNSSQQFNSPSIASVVNAISMGSVFSICYNPRTRSSKIIVPYYKFSKSVAHSFSAGMRFKIRFETEDNSERSGLIIGVSDADPIRWPSSKWKCLLVRWDDMKVNCLNRVSPWEIKAGSLSATNSFMLPSTKRNRVSFPTTKQDFHFPRDGNEVSSDFGEPLRFQKVLQGQEVSQMITTPYVGVESPNYHSSDTKFFHGPGGIGIHRNALSRETSQFHKVLQGQEIIHMREEEDSFRNVLNGVQMTRHGNGNTWSTPTHVYMHPSPSRPFPSLLMQQQNSPHSPFTSSNKELFYNTSQTISTKRGDVHGLRSIRGSEVPTQHFSRDGQNFVKNSCRLFGFSLTEGQGATSNVDTQIAFDGNFMACNKDNRLYNQPPLMTKVMVGNCTTKVSDMHAVRDMLLDIAL